MSRNSKDNGNIVPLRRGPPAVPCSWAAMPKLGDPALDELLFTTFNLGRKDVLKVDDISYWDHYDRLVRAYLEKRRAGR